VFFSQSGAIAAIPFIFVPLSGVFFGFLSQWLRGKGFLSHLTAYRIFNAICKCRYIFKKIWLRYVTFQDNHVHRRQGVALGC
jgi:hypothetical protein